MNSLINLMPILFLLAACKRMDPNPELIDPVYQDFVRLQKVYEKVAEEAIKSAAVAQTDYEKSEPRTLDIKIQEKNLNKASLNHREAQQRAEYYRVRAELRKAYARRDYKIAFQEGRAWPDPKEFEAYKVNKGLQEADRSWSSRVPKTQHQEISADSKTKSASQ